MVSPYPSLPGIGRPLSRCVYWRLVAKACDFSMFKQDSRRDFSSRHYHRTEMNRKRFVQFQEDLTVIPFYHLRVTEYTIFPECQRKYNNGGNCSSVFFLRQILLPNNFLYNFIARCAAASASILLPRHTPVIALSLCGTVWWGRVALQ